MILVGLCAATYPDTALAQSPDKDTVQLDSGDANSTAETTEQTDMNQLNEEALELKKAKERKRDIIVYSCFGLALFMILWMRKRRARQDP